MSHLYPIVYIKEEIEEDDEALDFNKEETDKGQVFGQISEFDKNQVRIRKKVLHVSCELQFRPNELPSSPSSFFSPFSFSFYSYVHFFCATSKCFLLLGSDLFNFLLLTLN